MGPIWVLWCLKLIQSGNPTGEKEHTITSTKLLASLASWNMMGSVAVPESGGSPGVTQLEEDLCREGRSGWQHSEQLDASESPGQGIRGGRAWRGPQKGVRGPGEGGGPSLGTHISLGKGRGGSRKRWIWGP